MAARMARAGADAAHQSPDCGVRVCVGGDGDGDGVYVLGVGWVVVMVVGMRVGGWGKKSGRWGRESHTCVYMYPCEPH